MRGLVINLARATARRDHMVRELEGTNIEYEFIEAVDGHALPSAERARLVDESAVARFPGWLTPGAIGCALSHVNAYEIAAARSDPVTLVLEDDVVLSSDINAILDQLAAHVGADHVALLHFRSFDPCRLRRTDAITVGERQILVPADPRQPLASSAYLLGREAAGRLASGVLPIRRAADSWGEFCDNGWIDLQCVYPHPVLIDTRMESTVGYGSALKALGSVSLTGSLRALNRRRIATRMSRVELVP